MCIHYHSIINSFFCSYQTPQSILIFALLSTHPTKACELLVSDADVDDIFPFIQASKGNETTVVSMDVEQVSVG